MNPVGDHLVVARLHLVGRDADGGAAVGIAAGHGNAGFVAGEILGDLCAGNVQDGWVPTDGQDRGAVGQAGGIVDLGRYAVDVSHPLGDVVEVRQPSLPFSGVVAAHPRFYRRQHPHDLFLADFIVAARPVVRRTELPSRLEQGFVAQYQAGALGSAQGFAAAVGHDSGTPLQVDIGNGEVFGRGIGEDGDVVRPGHVGNDL